MEEEEAAFRVVRRGREEATSDFACREVETEEGERAVAMAEIPSFGWKTGFGVVTEVMICEKRSDKMSVGSEDVGEKISKCCGAFSPPRTAPRAAP